MILDLPKCAEQGSRCSLSLVFTFLACLKMTQKWTSKWSPLRPEISARLLLGPPRNDFCSLFCASELKLKHVSKMCRIGRRFGGLEAGGSTMVSPSNLHRISIESPSNLHGISIESPWNLHRISIESPSRKHRLRSDEDPYIYTRCLESEGLSLRSRSLKHQIWARIEDGGYPARSTAEGVGGLNTYPSHGMLGAV